MHRNFSVAFAAVLTMLFVWSPVNGQTVPDKNSAELAFEIRMDQLRETPLYAMIKGAVDQARDQGGMSDEIDFDKVNRVWGAVQLPESVADMAAMENLKPGDALPMELFVHIEFVDSDSADAAMSQIMEESEEVTKNGTTYFAPREGTDAPSNLLARKLNATTMEAGTEGYITAGAGESLFSTGLGNAWGSFSGEPIRVAFDLDNARELIDEGLAMAKENSEPMMHGMLDLFNKMSNIRMAMDFKEGGNLLALGMASSDEESAEDLRKGLDGLLGMAKMMGGGQVDQLRQMDEGMADVASAILTSLNAERDGSDVQIVIPKPDGFEDAIQSMMQMNGGGDF